MQSRRTFIKQLAWGSGFLLAGGMPFDLLARDHIKTKITILHTNDVHSHLDSFPITDKNFPGLGGVARRHTLINQIRKEEKNVLLFDAGDYFQGTPYFNLYKGEAEIKAMNLMQYDACTIGNHEFDLGLENLATQLRKANFPVLNANYDFEKTPMKGITKRTKIFNIDGIKIGVFGVGVQLYGLVPAEAYGKTWHHDGIKVALEVSQELKNQGCDFIICLSHLGYEYNTEKASDLRLAKSSSHIDLIIGGHTHTFLDTPTIVKNTLQRDVIVTQAGWAGVKMGRLDFYFTPQKTFFLSKANTVEIGK